MGCVSIRRCGGFTQREREVRSAFHHDCPEQASNVWIISLKKVPNSSNYSSLVTSQNQGVDKFLLMYSLCLPILFAILSFIHLQSPDHHMQDYSPFYLLSDCVMILHSDRQGRCCSTVCGNKVKRRQNSRVQATRAGLHASVWIPISLSAVFRP